MKNSKLFSLLLIIVWGLTLTSCSKDEKGQDPIPAVVKLTADKTSVKADGKDQIVFSVTVDGTATSSGVSIIQKETTTALSGTTFSTKEAKDYTFYAMYDGEKSNEINITASSIIVKISADKTVLIPNGTDKAMFTITADDEDITSSATIYMQEGTDSTIISNHSFSTDASGTFTFYATYEGQKSDKITVKAATNTVTLTLSKNEIQANGTEKVSFNVQADGKDVTKSALVMQKGVPDVAFTGATFSTYSAGSYTFYAVYDSVKSEEVTLNATAAPLNFVQQFCVMQFTSVICNTCPRMTKAIETAIKTFHNEVPITFHVEKLCSNDKELYGILGPVADALCPSWPSSLINMYQKANIYPTTTYDNLIKGVDAMVGKCPSHTGIALQSKEADGVIEFTASVLTNQTDTYHFYAFIVEDGIVHAQKTNGEEVDEAYIHNNVATYKLSNDDPKTGINLGEIKSGQEKSQTYTIDTNAFTIPRTVNLAKCKVVAYTLRSVDGVYCIDNVTSCPVNGSVNYRLK